MFNYIYKEEVMVYWVAAESVLWLGTTTLMAQWKPQFYINKLCEKEVNASDQCHKHDLLK